MTHSESQVLVSVPTVDKRFKHINISENEGVEFCIILWGPLTEAVHVMVKTNDSGVALGESMKQKQHTCSTKIW